MEPILSVNNLTKEYGKKRVVNNVNFSIFEGQIFGFVGPNGAGKSTTLKMITGLAPITGGDAYINGHSIKNSFKLAISNVGAVIEMPTLYPYLSGMKNLKLFASLYGKEAQKRIPSIVKLVGMENRINDKVSTYSLGMKQRLGIAQALINRPKLLILDEPTNGLDPDGIVEIRNILKSLAKNEKMSILISSHNLSELEHICDSIAIINNGNIVANKNMKEIKEIAESKGRIELKCGYPNYAKKLLKNEYGYDCEITEDSVFVPIKEKEIAPIVAFLMTKKIKVTSIRKIEKSLEETYFEILKSERSSTSIN